MTRVETLREQASILRTLAESFNDAVIRGDLLRVADRCEDLATRIAAALQQEKSRPKADPLDVRIPPTADTPSK